MQVLVTGATGFIGSHFVPFLAQRGHVVQRVTRRPSHPGDVAWDPARGEARFRVTPEVAGWIRKAAAGSP